MIKIDKKMTPQERYKKKNIKQLKIELNLKTDEDILQKLESVPNKAGYIKSLIRKDIEENK